jgi:hypothetical protein
VKYLRTAGSILRDRAHAFCWHDTHNHARVTF